MVMNEIVHARSQSLGITCAEAAKVQTAFTSEARQDALHKTKPTCTSPEYFMRIYRHLLTVHLAVQIAIISWSKVITSSYN
jgi:hypothetical protein